MPAGRANPPLVIWVYYPWLTHPKVVELHDAGHKLIGIQSEGAGLTPVTVHSHGGTPDLILHPAAHFWTDDMWDYLPAALTAGRKRKKERKQS